MVFSTVPGRCASSSNSSSSSTGSCSSGRSYCVLCLLSLVCVAAFQPQFALASHNSAFPGDGTVVDSSSSSSRGHRIVISAVPSIEDEQKTRLEVCLFGPKTEDDASGKKLKGLLYASIQGSYAEVDSSLLDGDYKTLATLLTAVRKEGEALGAEVVWSSLCSSSINVLGHIFAGFRPQFQVEVHRTPQIVWTAETSEFSREQLREQNVRFGLRVLPFSQASASQKEELEAFFQKHNSMSLNAMSAEQLNLCFFAVNHRGSIVQALVSPAAQEQTSSPAVEFVGPASMSTSVALLGGLRQVLDLGAVKGAVLRVSPKDARMFCIAVDAGFLPVSITKHEVVFAFVRTDKSDHMFPYTVERRIGRGRIFVGAGGELWEKADLQTAETEGREEEPGSIAQEPQQMARGRWKWALAELKRRGQLVVQPSGEAVEADVPGAPEEQQAVPYGFAPPIMDVVNLQGLGLGLAGALVLTLLFCSMASRRRRRSRFQPEVGPLSYMLFEAELAGEGTKTEGVAVEARLPDNAAQSPS
ncbi:hypothetical protein Efla_002443 [Eimeria flavescens]